MGCVTRMPATTSSPWALSQEVAFEAWLPVVRCATWPRRLRESVAHVAKHHGLDVHGRAQVVGECRRRCGSRGALAVPRTEHRFDGESELLEGIIGEWATREPFARLLEFGRDSPRSSAEVGVLDHARSCDNAPVRASNGSSRTPSTTEPNICTRRR